MAGNLIIFSVYMYFITKTTYFCISIIPSAENRFMFNLWSLLKKIILRITFWVELYNFYAELQCR